MSAAIGIVVFILWIWALVDVLRNDFRNGNKVIWLLTVILLPGVGIVLYFLIGRCQKVGNECAVTESTSNS